MLYDGASNMSGVHSGVQKRIRDDQPLYVHCRNHSLNMALQDATSNISSIRDALSLTNDMANFSETHQSEVGCCILQ